jgi:hypothetical protein
MLCAEGKAVNSNNPNSCADQNQPNLQGTAVSDLERQMERGSLFTHTVLGTNLERLNEVETFTYGLIDAGRARCRFNRGMSSAAANVREKLIERGDARSRVLVRIEEDPEPLQ